MQFLCVENPVSLSQRSTSTQIRKAQKERLSVRVRERRSDNKERNGVDAERETDDELETEGLLMKPRM